ncbi:translation initiation factor eIF3 subunit-domain-containing protein [Kalaharituber pfeilii]|nr:translation initiation factor eIF3 subunit-domain-containing protein [Kalaharituber pfeilii]
MSGNWDDEESVPGEKQSFSTAVGKKWDDEENEDLPDSWDQAEDSEAEREKAEKASKAAAEAAANKKSKTERIADHKAASAARKAAEEAERLARENETPEERRRRLQQEEIENDLKHAVDLFAGVTVEDRAGGPDTTKGDDAKRKAISLTDPKDPARTIDLSVLPIFNPSTKKQFTDLQEILVPLLGANIRKAHYPLFVQEMTRLLVKDMSSEHIRKVASTCTTLANEKLKEEKAAEKGTKKTKGSKKTSLVGAAGKDNDKLDTKTYEDFVEFPRLPGFIDSLSRIYITGLSTATKGLLSGKFLSLLKLTYKIILREIMEMYWHGDELGTKQAMSISTGT